jgi:hypothetical protein
MALPDNTDFPHSAFRGDLAEHDNAFYGFRSLHEQLCVVADLLRELIGEMRALQS